MPQAGFYQQLKALMWRNCLLKARNTRRSVAEILVPVFWILFLALIKWITVGKDSVGPINGFPAYPLPRRMLSNSLYVISENASAYKFFDEKVLPNIAPPGTLDVSYFDSSASAERQYKNDSAYSPVGIVFGSSIYKYSIRIAHEYSVDTSTVSGNLGLCRDGTQCPADQYLNNGFLFLQAAIDSALLEVAGANAASVALYMNQKMPKPGYIPDSGVIRGIAPIYYALAYSLCIQLLVISLVTEKQKKQKEVLKIMGMRDSAFWLSWSLLYFVLVLLISTLATVLAIATNFFRPPSNMFIFFLMLMLYGMSIINLAFVITPFFDNPKVAGPFASILVAFVSLLFFAVSLTTTYGPNGEPHSTIPIFVEWLLCLLSPAALAIGIDRSLYLDIAGIGVTWESATVGDFPLMAPLIMLAVDVVLYFVLAVWLDNVMTGEYGQRRPIWFCLMPSYWRRRLGGDPLLPSTANGSAIEYSTLVEPDGTLADCESSRSTNNGSAGLIDVEPVSSDLRELNKLRIMGIRKTFKTGAETTHAICGINLDVYEGQITALLGHNGAGKTTLLNMLTGLMPPTAGTATVYGLDVADTNDMNAIRTMTGICPQQNVLFELLTPREHLSLYSDLKGVDPRTSASKIEAILADLEMTEQANTLARDLSGGQQRKLSVALALVGDPKLIFLDEPSAGLDPSARRKLWSLLKSKKEGRVILLTTHFMDEADILADRKAIISKGILRCCGSSLYLKTKFGVGYHLNLVTEPSSYQSEQVASIIERHITGAKLDQQHGMSVSFTMPHSGVDKFPALFNALEEKTGQGTMLTTALGIKSYGISMTTLEEVFLALGEESDNRKSNETNNENTQLLSEKTGTSNGGKYRGAGAESEAAHQLSQLSAPRLLPAATRERHKLLTLMWLRFTLIKRNKKAAFLRVVLPLIMMVVSMCVIKFVKTTGGDNANTVVPLLLTPGLAFSDAKPIAFVNATGTDISSFGTSLSNVTGQSVEYIGPGVDLLQRSPHQYGVNVTRFVSAMQAPILTLLYTDTALHSLPVTLNVINNARLGMLPNGLGKVIQATAYPWPSLSISVQFDTGSFIFSMFIGSALITMLGSFSSETVKDRECKARSQLRISGATNRTYWGSIFLVDLIQVFGAAIFIIILIAAFQIPALTTSGALLSIVIYFVLYMPLFLLYCYLYSYLFDKYETCQSVLPPVFSLLNFLPFIAIAVLSAVSNMADLVSNLHYIFVALDPLYTLSGVFFYINKLYMTESIMQQTNQPVIPVSHYMDWNNGIVVTFVPVIVWIPLLCLLIVIADIRKHGGSASDLFCKSTAPFNSDLTHTHHDGMDWPEDDDVAEERHLVVNLESDRQADTPILVNGLRKEFPKRKSTKELRGDKPKVKVAVKGVTFHVSAGEVFGLLGPNGAGKSTVLNMLTAEIAPSAGTVNISGKDILSNVSEAYQIMGYCPQYDALWENLTLEEHLSVYAAMRGMTEECARQASDLFIQALCLEEHRKKQAMTLSGGTKRKLSFAMSMVGAPQIVLMDEPSTGMDPQSKRVFWDAIASSFSGTSRGAVLTTHYMEEADALCRRIAIMVNGRLECLGTSQHLKDKHGSGYILDAKLYAGSSGVDGDSQIAISKARLHSYLTSSFPSATIMESFGDRVSYRITKQDVQSLAKAFAVLEEAKRLVNVSEYSFSQATLEQVFLTFAKQQLEADDDESNLNKRRESSRALSVNFDDAVGLTV